MAEPLSKYLSRLLSAVLGFVSQACAYGAFGALLSGGGYFSGTSIIGRRPGYGIPRGVGGCCNTLLKISLNG